MTYDGPIKCTYSLGKKLKPNEEPDIHITLEHQDGSLLSTNEDVEIGRDPWPHKIPLNLSPLTWKLENYTPDIPSMYWTKRAFATMFRTIGLVIPMKYQAVRNNSFPAFFNIRFTDDIDVFGGREGVLAHAYLYHPYNPPQWNGLMEWNDNHFFTPFGEALPAWIIDPDHFTEGEKLPNGNLKTLASQPLVEIGMHELKHNHGYYHNTLESSSLMYPFVKRGVQTTVNGDTIINRIIKSSFQWSNSDLQRWEDGYGRRQLGLGRLNRMRARRVKVRKVPELPYSVSA